jgi:ectoine hydroxylase-related dioxygenase (phytanoyl-CoA dioxygenase family)
MLNPQDVNQFRSLFLRMLSSYKDNENISGKVSSSSFSNFIDKAKESALSSEEYRKISQSKRLTSFLKTFLGGPVCAAKRKLIRYKKAHSEEDTGAHYDFTYLRCGTDKFLTCWIPLGDTSIEMGGLIYLNNSTEIGKRIEQKFNDSLLDFPPRIRQAIRGKGMGGIGWIGQNLGETARLYHQQWLAADYEAGDVVFHNPYIIHASSSNEDLANRIRLSTDIRYRRVDSNADPRWGQVWRPNDGL